MLKRTLNRRTWPTAKMSLPRAPLRLAFGHVLVHRRRHESPPVGTPSAAHPAAAILRMSIGRRSSAARVLSIQPTSAARCRAADAVAASLPDSARMSAGQPSGVRRCAGGGCGPVHAAGAPLSRIDAQSIDSAKPREEPVRNPNKRGFIYRITAGPPQGSGAPRPRLAAPLPRADGMRGGEVFSP